MNGNGTVRVNVGCGQSPTAGWRNFDNSFSIRLARVPFVADALHRVGLIDARQFRYVQFARQHHIEYGTVTKRLPLRDGTVDVLYSSHMLEHLDASEVRSFLDEARRLLRPGGTIRLAVPDISLQVRDYLASGDADAFISGTHLSAPRARTLRQRCKALVIGSRHHQWMYDGASLTRLLQAHGFVDPKVVPAGTTSIENPAPLDLAERSNESVYVEARKPASAGR